MRTEAEIRKMMDKFDDAVEEHGGDTAWDAIIDTLNWVLEFSKDLSQYDPE